VKIAIIGAGRMGGAILERLLEIGFTSKDNIIACDINENRLIELKQRFGINVSKDNKDGAKFGDIIIIAVMPKQMKEILEEIKPYVKSKIIVSVVGLVTTNFIENILGNNISVVRVMPNIPSLIGSGFNLVTFGKFIKAEERKQIEKMLSYLGEYREIDEDKMELYTIICAAGPTYFFPFIDVLINFGVENGLDEKLVREAIALTLKGTADMVLKVPKPIEELKNMIGLQPLKPKEEELKKIFKEIINKTLIDLNEMKKQYIK
jgi:pyrroline-5-carboxylate reductase